MRHIDSYNFSGKRALIRVDFNVPLNENFEITDDNRIRAAIPTIKKITDSGGSAVIMSHLGRPDGSYEEKYSLRYIVPHLSKLTGKEVKFATDCIGDETVKMANQLLPGEIMLLENLRFYKAETKGDRDFAKKLAELADVYVNDAFGTAHRARSSTARVSELFAEEKMFGYLMEKELESMEKVLNKAEKPFTTIMGGAKVSEKILIIENLLNQVDNLIIGGGLAYTFIKASGGKTGSSSVEEDRIEIAKKLVSIAKEKGVNLVLPVDNVVADKLSNDSKTKEVPIDEIPDGWMGLDIGSKTIEKFTSIIKSSKTILWNGPLGVFEIEKFENGTKSIANAISEATSNGAFSLIGGGDSVGAIKKYKLENKVSFVSTGGGAMLEYMEGKILPGIEAIRGSE